MKVKGRTNRPDGTLRDDDWQLPRGYWEAKDNDDSLDDEIRKKVAKGHPLLNTIFEDTRHGVLFQNGREVARVKLDDPDQLATLLSQFYSYTKKTSKASSRRSRSSRSASRRWRRRCWTRSSRRTRRTRGSRPRSTG
jgi:hypothetical protein